jgi:nucleoid-associated protein YgaU
LFGQVGSAFEEGHLTTPRYQVGVRWRPIDQFSVDVIYGRNITGENANWITVGTTIRFPPK